MTFEVSQNNSLSPKIEVSPSRRLKKFWIVGIILGVVLATANIFTLGALGFVFQVLTPPFIEIPLKLSGCSGERCWGVLILLGSLLFLIFVPLAVVFLGYLYNFKSYPNTKKIRDRLFRDFVHTIECLNSITQLSPSIYLTGLGDCPTLYASYNSMSE